MAVDLAQDAHVQDLAERTARFVREVVVPVEEAHGGVLPSDGERVRLQDAARAAGVFAPHAAPSSAGTAWTCAAAPRCSPRPGTRCSARSR
nr:hypothetical protein [Pseudonocardia sp. AL041005-10]